MLDDAAIERFSRQILLPEVGGRGQERLCATTAVARGDGAAAAFAAMLLHAAGVRVLVEPGAPAGLDVTIPGAAVIGVTTDTRVVVTTLVGRPCARCAPPVEAPGADRGPAHAQTLGALVAAEALRAALGLARAGRRQEIDLATGAVDARPIAPAAPCPECPPAAA